MKQIEQLAPRTARQEASSSEPRRQWAAAEQAALHITKLALARYAAGDRCATVGEHLLHPLSDQACWHAQNQENFQNWLRLGGFAQENGCTK